MTVAGELIDTACFVTSDGDAKGKDHAACATKCMATGEPAGILPEGAKYADETIKVERTAYEHRHAINVKKLSVTNGENGTQIPHYAGDRVLVRVAKPATTKQVLRMGTSTPTSTHPSASTSARAGAIRTLIERSRQDQTATDH